MFKKCLRGGEWDIIWNLSQFCYSVLSNSIDVWDPHLLTTEQVHTMQPSGIPAQLASLSANATVGILPSQVGVPLTLLLCLLVYSLKNVCV